MNDEERINKLMAFISMTYRDNRINVLPAYRELARLLGLKPCEVLKNA
jgi:hypothetical protein